MKSHVVVIVGNGELVGPLINLSGILFVWKCPFQDWCAFRDGDAMLIAGSVPRAFIPGGIIPTCYLIAKRHHLSGKIRGRVRVNSFRVT